jgi:hypothetical protein
VPILGIFTETQHCGDFLKHGATLGRGEDPSLDFTPVAWVLLCFPAELSQGQAFFDPLVPNKRSKIHFFLSYTEKSPTLAALFIIRIEIYNRPDLYYIKTSKIACISGGRLPCLAKR